MIDKEGESKPIIKANDDKSVRKYDVFVSYTRADVEKASRVVKALESVGYHVWWDSYIQGGTSFTQEIEKALAECYAVVVLWSGKSKDSLYVQNEAHFANNHKKQIPLIIEDIDLPLQVLSLHVIKLFNWKGSVKADEFVRIVEAIEIVKKKSLGAAYQPTSTVTSAKNGKGLRLAIYLLGGLFLAGLAMWINSYRVSNFKPQELVIGVMLRTNWKVCQTKQVYSSLASRMNTLLQQGGNEKLSFNSSNILTYTSYEKLSQDLKAGKVNIVGELSPYRIYVLHKKLGVEPYVSPNYSGKDTYKAVLFSTAANNNWEALIAKLSNDSEAKVALFDNTSTAGYWYPKYLLSNEIISEREITDILLPKHSYDEVYAAVNNNFEGAIVGAMAEFKHCKRDKELSEEECLKNYPIVARTGAIPNGGFVMSKSLKRYLEKMNYIGLLQRIWSATAIDTLDNGLLAESTELCQSTAEVPIKKYLEKNWTRVTIENYSSAFQMFEN
ncbi:MAG: TIR domain-containing protein [Methylococcaceae bacterium]|nr:TIR domain-containing protein [Methylococcaceae bacterium]